jgi:hypothetical protein
MCDVQRRFNSSLAAPGLGEEEADGLRLLIVVSACGAFVAAFRKHAEIVLVDVHRQPPNSAARPFPVRSHSLSRRCHGCLPPWQAMVYEKRL